MRKVAAARPASSVFSRDEVAARDPGEITACDEVAQRRERLAAHVAHTRALIVYRFVMPTGATVKAAGTEGQIRDARDQLHLIVGMVGGGVAKSVDGLAARIPKVVAQRFEVLARELIEHFLISLDLGDDIAQSREARGT